MQCVIRVPVLSAWHWPKKCTKDDVCCTYVNVDENLHM